MSTVAAWKWILPEVPPFWQWFFSGEDGLRGKNGDSGSEVLQRAECHDFGPPSAESPSRLRSGTRVFIVNKVFIAVHDPLGVI